MHKLKLYFILLLLLSLCLPAFSKDSDTSSNAWQNPARRTRAAWDASAEKTHKILDGLDPEHYQHILDTPIKLEQIPFEALEDSNILPKNFEPSARNTSGFGPHSRFSDIPNFINGPWDFIPVGRRIWWDCVVHGNDAQGNYAGAIRFYFNLLTGEIYKPHYAPDGNMTWFKPNPVSSIYIDLPHATSVSSFAYADMRIYRSLHESGYVPPSYQLERTVKNDGLRGASKGGLAKFTNRPFDSPDNWRKVIEDGRAGRQAVEAHYFKNEATGEVTRVEFYEKRVIPGQDPDTKIEIKVDDFANRNGDRIVLRKKVRRNHILPQVVKSPHDSYDYITANKNVFDTLNQDIRTSKSKVLHSQTPQLFSPDQYDPPPMPEAELVKAPAEVAEQAAPQVDLTTLVPELKERQLKEAAMLMMQYNELYKEINSIVLDPETMAELSGKLPTEVLIVQQQLISLLFKDGLNYADQYQVFFKEEKVWMKELANLKVEDRPEVLTMIEDLRNDRLVLLRQFLERLNKLATSHFSSKSGVRIDIATNSESSAQELRFIYDIYKAYVDEHNTKLDESSHWKVVHKTPEGSTKSIIIEIEGPGVFERFQYEDGAHRIYLYKGQKYKKQISVRVSDLSIAYDKKRLDLGEDGFIRTYSEKEGEVWDERFPGEKFPLQTLQSGNDGILGQLHLRLFTRLFKSRFTKSMSSTVNKFIHDIFERKKAAEAKLRRISERLPKQPVQPEKPMTESQIRRVQLRTNPEESKRRLEGNWVLPQNMSPGAIQSAELEKLIESREVQQMTKQQMKLAGILKKSGLSKKVSEFNARELILKKIIEELQLLDKKLPRSRRNLSFKKQIRRSITKWQSILENIQKTRDKFLSLAEAFQKKYQGNIFKRMYYRYYKPDLWNAAVDKLNRDLKIPLSVLTGSVRDATTPIQLIRNIQEELRIQPGPCESQFEV